MQQEHGPAFNKTTAKGSPSWRSAYLGSSDTMMASSACRIAARAHQQSASAACVLAVFWNPEPSQNQDQEKQLGHCALLRAQATLRRLCARYTKEAVR